MAEVDVPGLVRRVFPQKPHGDARRRFVPPRGAGPFIPDDIRLLVQALLSPSNGGRLLPPTPRTPPAGTLPVGPGRTAPLPGGTVPPASTQPVNPGPLVSIPLPPPLLPIGPSGPQVGGLPRGGLPPSPRPPRMTY